MGINPLAAARKEAQRQTYIDEERKLVELGKRRKDAAKKAASENKEKDLIGARNAETESVFDKIGRDYAESSHQEKEDEKDDEWLREFETSLKEETGVSPRDKAVKQRNETVVNTYNTGEEWLMNDGDNDLAKGFINRARSSVGKGVEDFAYMLNDIAPWYEPAKNVVEKNTAGSISAKADKQFENAKSRTGDFGDNLIDIADGAAETLGLSMFGPKALTYAFGTKEGFGEYRKQRENGVSKEVAFRRALAKAGYSVAVEKVDDFIGKNNLVDDWLDGQSGIVRKLDSNRVKSYNEEKLSIKEYARLQSAVMTNHPNEKGYIKQILDNENGDPAIIYDVYIKDDGSMMVFGRSGGRNIHEGRKEYKNGRYKGSADTYARKYRNK